MALSNNAEAPQRSENTRHAILNAAVNLYHAQGVPQTTASAIIAASGVGRATFYRHFSDQDEVLNEALKRDFESMLDAYEAQRFDHRTLETQIIEDLAWFLRQMQAKPALSLIFGQQRDQFLPRINATLDEFRNAAQICVKPIFERARTEGRVREGVTVEAYVHWVAFVATSLQVVDAPFSKDDFKLRDALRQFLLPSLIRDPNDALD